MMLTPMLLALITGHLQVAAACSGPAPAIVQAAVRSVQQDGDLNNYTVAITVANQGNATQPGNTLQSVEVYQDTNKVDEKGLPPLRPGQAATVTYVFHRSIEARDNTTDLHFKLVFQNPVPGPVACDVPNAETDLRV